MSVWSNVFTWAIHAAQSDAAKKAELQAVQSATGALLDVVNKHAPDLAPSLQPLFTQIGQAAVAGILSKAGR